VDLKTKTVDELFIEMFKQKPGKRQVCFAELLTRSSLDVAGVVAQLDGCRKPIRGLTATGRQRKGLTRCRHTVCSSCQVWAGKREGIWSWSLIGAASNEMPERNAVSFVSVNAPDRNLRRFNRRIKLVMRRLGLRYTGQYAVSLNGMLHVHMSVLHPGMTLFKVDAALKREFGPYPAVLCKPFYEDQEVQDAVRNVSQYAPIPIKQKDFVKQQHLMTPDAMAQYVLWDAEVTGSRRVQGGFTKEERDRAHRIRKRIRGKKLRVYAGAVEIRNKELLERLRQFKRSRLGKEPCGDIEELGSGGVVGQDHSQPPCSKIQPGHGIGLPTKRAADAS
jgi:hypothetical protein